MVRLRNGNDESFDFLTEYVVQEMWNILSQPVMYIKIYTPAKPHISIASEDDFKMGVNPEGFSPGANASQITGGSYKDSYQSREISFIKLT